MEIVLIGGDWDGERVVDHGQDEVSYPKKLRVDDYAVPRAGETTRQCEETDRYTRRRFIMNDGRRRDVLGLSDLTDQQVWEIVRNDR